MISASTPAAACTISVVEDEPVLRQEMAFQLEHLGFSVKTFSSASEFYRDLAVAATDIALLDIGLAGEDGLSICAHLRRHDPLMGIVFVTARAQRADRLQGLATGADAYLTKPVDMDELALILHRLSQRIPAPVAAPGSPDPLGTDATAWQLDLGILSRLTAPNGARKHLSNNERILLGTLAQNPAKACSHAVLAAALGLHPDEFDKHRLEVIVSRLRSSVERSTGLELPLKAIRGVGYSLGNVQLVGA